MSGMRNLVFAVLVAFIASFFLTAASVRALAPAPPLQAEVNLVSSTFTIPGHPPAIPMPSSGSMAVAVEGAGVVAQKNGSHVGAIGSIAKIMTALLVLRAHPLAPGAQGPTLTINAADVADYERVVAEDGSSVAVTLGEKLTERDLLLGLLLPSANNFADLLGTWVAGSDGAFVAQMNAQAQALGMNSTHFADTSGYSSQTVSTPLDLITLGRVALANPTLAQLVRTQQATMTNGETIYNLDSLLSTPGWLGIKTGETGAAGACLLFAAREQVAGGHFVTVIGAQLGASSLSSVFSSVSRAVTATVDAATLFGPAALPMTINGYLRTAWGSASHVTPVMAGNPQIVVFPGETVDALLTISATSAENGLSPGHRVGEVTLWEGGQVVARWNVLLNSPIKPAPIGWRILND